LAVTLLAVVIVTTLASLAGAADPECVYRKIRGLSSHWPNPASCSSYYRCSSKNTVRSVTCPAGKEYNPKNGKCSTAGRGLCKLTLAAPLAETTNACSNEVNGAYVARTGYCGEFFICDEQLAYPQQCASGSYFETTVAACIPDTNTTCWQNLCIGQASGAFLADEAACNSFYVCADAEATLQTCPLGSYFDSSLKACTVDTDNSNCWTNFCIGKADGSAVADKSNCSIFYVCSDNTATEQVCPEGSYFEASGWACVPGTCPTEPPCDEETTTTCEPVTTTTEPCDEVTTTTTESPAVGCDCGDEKNGDLVVDSANCRKYLICDNGILKAGGDCGQGNWFEPTIKSCTPDVNNQCCVSEAECTENDVKVDVQDCTKYSVCQNGDWVSKTCAIGSYFNGYICQEDTENVCIDSTTTTTVATITTEFVAMCNARDPPASGKNCWSYSACIDGRWVDETCLVDYYFDAATGICRQDTTGTVCPENRSMAPKKLKKTKKTKGSREKRSVDAEDCTCEGGIEQGTILPHPTECDKYLICENGQLIEGSCGVGNIFKNCSGVCAPDTGATCWVCANKPNGYQMVNPSDCTSYFTCWGGLATQHSCGSGEWYNNDGECAIDVNARCINPCTCSTGNVAHPICTDYFQCTDGVAQVVECPTGQAFDSATGQCSATVECSAKNCATADDYVTYPVAGDSNKFYLCLNQEATIVACPANSAYNETLSMCQTQPSCSCDQSVCQGASTEDQTYPSLNNDTSTFCVCQNGGGYLNSCPSGLFYDDSTGTCDFTGNCDPQVCTGQEEYYVSPDYVDTNSFCLCRVGEPIAVPCPIGYTFNSAELTCVLIPQPDPRCCSKGCLGKTDFTTIPAVNDDYGFCICMDEVPVFKSCADNAKYDDVLGTCIASTPGTSCEENVCNATLCDTLVEYDTFPAPCTPTGFCYCENFCPIFQNCSVAGQEYNSVLGMCATPVDPSNQNCNDTQCDTLGEYETFPPNNGLEGFCYCEGGLGVYTTCLNADEVYDADTGVCVVPTDACATKDCNADLCATLPDYEPFPTNTGGEDNPNFCYCDNGNVNIGTCGQEMVFDAVQGRCIVQAASTCICAAGVCTSNDDYQTYPALNSTEGFCLCTAGVPVFKSCAEGSSYSTVLGVCTVAGAKISAAVECDPTRCHNRALFAVSFAAMNTSTGYCTCEDVGLPEFHKCAEAHLYEEVLGSCVIEACDSMLCANRVQNEPFEAKNTTSGFCSCDGIASFHHCPAGEVFDNSRGLCALKDAIAAMITCNLQECKMRAQFEPFPSQNSRSGFCSCDDEQRLSVTYHPCALGQLFAPELGLCQASHDIQKRSLEAEENLCMADEKRSVPANCSQYEICIEGHWKRRTCSDLRYYNPEQQQCLEPRDDMVCAYARAGNLPTCQDLNESQTVVARSGNCLQYFRCSGGKWRLRNCSKQHYYSPLVGTCLPLPKEREQDRNQTICSWVRDLRPPNFSEDCQHLAVRPSRVAGCHSYLMCLDNAWWLQRCPLGMYFSREHNYCLPNDRGQCSLPEEQSNESCSVGESRALVGSCHSYEVCQDGQWMRHRCQEREQFEPLLGCVPSDGSCQSTGLRRICREGELRSQASGNCSQGFLFCESEEWRLGSCLRGHSFAGESNKCLVKSQCQMLKGLSTENQCLGQSDGYSVPDLTDCTRFYLCLQQQASILQSCASGSFFDSEQRYCRPNDGTCQLAVCSGMEDGKLVAHPEDCQAYYNCSRRYGTSLLRCAEGHYFHSLLSLCRVDNGQCVKVSNEGDTETIPRTCAGLHGMKLPHELYCNLYYACVKGLAIPVECPAEQQFNPVLSTCEPESLAVEPCRNGQLEGNGNGNHMYSCGILQDGTFLANRTDCTRYFICAGGVAMAQRCAAGSFFDSEQLLCLADDGSCPLVESEGDDEETNNQHVPPDPLVCEGKNGYILPDPANCNNFYLCVSGQLRHELCYADYFFNSTLQQCQAYEANSSGDLTTEQPVEGILGGQEKVGASVGICKDTPTTFEGICAVIGSSFLAEQGDCRRYTSCEDEVAISQKCRNGESFDSLLGICRQSDGTCLMENGERVGVCNGKHGQLARDADNCRGYFVCVHGQKIEGECDQGQFFNRLTNSCEVDTLQQCKIEGDDTIIGDISG
ncbi:hypothetical protein KR009_009220, partial [Drosophila setifemur]